MTFSSGSESARMSVRVAATVEGCDGEELAEDFGDAGFEHVRLGQGNEETRRKRFVGVYKVGKKQHARRSALTKRAFEPHQIGARQAIAKRARNGRAKSRAARSEAQVACGCDHEPPAGRRAIDHRQGRHGQRLDFSDAPLEARLIADAVFAGREPAKFGDIGSRNKCG